MTRSELLVEFVKATVWPVTTLIILLILRKPITSLVGLIGTIKYKDLEITITRDLAAAKDEIASKVAKPASRLQRQVTDYSKLIEVSPRAAIIEAWIALEAAGVRAMSRAIAFHSSASPAGSPRFEEFLFRKGLIDGAIREAVHRLRNIRNQVAHASQYVPSSESAEEFTLLANAVTVDLDDVNPA